MSPRNTQVYVDGYFVGVVDNFDGTLQRLNIEAGEHELQLYLEGYRPFTQRVLFPRGGTLRITHAMEPLAPGESSGAPPKPDPAARQQPDPGTRMQPEYGNPNRQGPPSVTGRIRSQISDRCWFECAPQTRLFSSMGKRGPRPMGRTSSR